MKEKPLLRADGLHFSYGQRTVLQGLTLEVEEGEMVALVGPNGSGKTTLLRLISGTLRPERGQVYLRDKALSSLPPRERARRIAVVPQSPAVPEGFTCLEVVLMGRNPHLGFLQWEGPRDLALSREAMELTGTWAFAHRPINLLSGGERQRVFIARALTQGAPLLLLDEPTAHLDVAYQTAILDLIEVVRRETGVTVLAAMHDLTLAAQYCRRLAVLHQGRIAAQGSPQEVLTPERVAQVYGAPVSIVAHPVHGTPAVLPVRKDGIGRGEGP